MKAFLFDYVTKNLINAILYFHFRDFLFDYYVTNEILYFHLRAFLFDYVTKNLLNGILYFHMRAFLFNYVTNK